MTNRRSSGSVVVQAPRVGDALGSALRNAFRAPDSCQSDWDSLLRRVDRAELHRR